MGRDWLTGVGDRGELFRLLWDAGTRWGTLAMIDVDHMKLVNHERGHTAGDDALCGLVQRIVAALPEGSVVCRMGGDEFAVLTAAGELRLATALETVNDTANADQLVFSAGVVSLAGSGDIESRLSDADAAMFLAKRQGRRAVVVHGPSTERHVAERRELFGRITRLHEENLRLREEASTDALTGIGNRRALDQRVALTASRDSTLWAVLFIDVDGLHDLNRRNGDAAGDGALTAVARALSSSLRPADTIAAALAPRVFRKGGDEFVVIAAVSEPADAARLGERLRAVVEDLRIPLGVPDSPVLTVCVGVALGDHDTSVRDALRVADARTSWLKNHGRRNEVRARDDVVDDDVTDDDVTGDDPDTDGSPAAGFDVA